MGRHLCIKVGLVSIFVLVATAARTAHAQAWVSAKGQLDLALDYNLGVSDKVIGKKSSPCPSFSCFPKAGTTTNEVTLGVGYVPVSHLEIDASLPFAALKYTGTLGAYPHPGGGRYDDGKYHTTLTDLRVGARYQALEEPLALTPFIAVSVPVAKYETIGNTVAGRHLKALHLGLALGKEITEQMYVHLQYQFSLVEKYDRTADTKKFGQNRSEVGLTLGYTLLQNKLDLNVDANYHLTHGGVDFEDFAMLTPDEQNFHDAILRESIFLVGAGVGYQVTPKFGVSLAARFFVSGTNTQNASVYALGLTFTPL